MAVFQLGAAPKVDTRRTHNVTSGPSATPPKSSRPWNKYRGRPPMLTEDLIEEFVLLIGQVLYVETAARLLGINACTWALWMRLGRTELMNIEKGLPQDPSKDIYVSFLMGVRWALADVSRKHLGNIGDAGGRWWQASAWLMERRHPEKWGSQAQEIKEIKKGMEELAKAQAATTPGTVPGATHGRDDTQPGTTPGAAPDA